MPGTYSCRYPACQGFTLIELVVVIVISGALATTLAQLVQRPIEMYQAQSRRAALVDQADTALRRISLDVRQALPNSVRVGCAGRCIEFMQVISGGRYRSAPAGNPFHLSFNPADNDTEFQVLGFLPDSDQVRTGAAASDCRTVQASCLVIYNTGLTGTDAFNMDNAATITAVSTAASVISISFINSAFTSSSASPATGAFPASSPMQRFYVVDTPVTYLCDLAGAAGSIRRYQGYNIQPLQASVDTHAELTSQSNPAEHALLVDNVSACQFSYTAGTPTRNGLVNIDLSVEQKGERITLSQQIHVSNMP